MTGVQTCALPIYLPQITSINVPERIIRGENMEIPIKTQFATRLYFFVNDASGSIISNGIIPIVNDSGKILVDSDTTKKMQSGGNDIKIYAISDSVFKPDIYTTSIFALDKTIGNYTQSAVTQKTQSQTNYGIQFILAGIVIIILIYFIKKSRKSKTRIS